MEIKFLRGACVIIEANGLRILCDPWLTDGEYYGAWAHYPPYEWKDDLNVDYIYVSHIHPDHFSAETMRRLPKAPVLIHDFHSKFLRRNIESLDFEVRELPHNIPTDLGKNVTINILAADDCNPEVCGRFFACTKPGIENTQIDSMCVIQDGKETLVNVNDCPYDLAKAMLPRLRLQYPVIDRLLVAYAGAGPYPQCFDMPEGSKRVAAQLKASLFIEYVITYAKELKAKSVLPFAGDYVLQGSLAKLNPYRGVPDIEEVYTALVRAGISGIETTPPVNYLAKEAYIDEVLSKRTLDYESDPLPGESEFGRLMVTAAQRLEARRQELGFLSTTRVYIPVGPRNMAVIYFDSTRHSIGFVDRIWHQSYIKMTVDPRLLKRILMGPKHAHWNNAEIGSHIMYERKPDKFERGISQLMSYLHI